MRDAWREKKGWRENNIFNPKKGPQGMTNGHKRNRRTELEKQTKHQTKVA